MRTGISQAPFFCFLLLIAFMAMANAYAEPEPMARPTRPKVITSPEELKRYLDLVKDYYNLNGRARYGKRGDVAPMSELNATWEILMKQMIQDAQRQSQQRRLEKLRQSKEHALYRDFHSTDVDKHASRAATRPGYLLDIAGRYYDDVQ